MDDTHLLLACDDDDVSTTLVGFFERAGYLVSRERSVDDALATVDRGAPDVDVVVTDFRRGGTGQGVQLLDQLRSSDDRAVRAIRVIITTDLDENRLFSWQSGVDDFLIRPFHVNELAEAVSAALGRGDEARAAYRDERLAADAHPRASGDG